MNETRRTFLMALPGAAGVMAQSRGRRPNILILLTDQQTQSALSAHGNTSLGTKGLVS